MAAPWFLAVSVAEKLVPGAAWAGGLVIAVSTRSIPLGVADTCVELELSFAPLSAGQREKLFRLLSRALAEGSPPQRVGF